MKRTLKDQNRDRAKRNNSKSNQTRHRPDSNKIAQTNSLRCFVSLCLLCYRDKQRPVKLELIRLNLPYSSSMTPTSSVISSSVFPHQVSHVELFDVAAVVGPLSILLATWLGVGTLSLTTGSCSGESILVCAVSHCSLYSVGRLW